MSFVPAPQQAGASTSANTNNATATAAAPSLAAAAAVTPTPEGSSEWELTFKTRSYDVFWIEKNALMYKDGITKVRRVEFRALLPDPVIVQISTHNIFYLPFFS